MAVTSYDTLNGRIRGQSSAGARTDFLTDALGSVTATVDSTPAVVNTYRNKAYGVQLAKTGAGIDPKFLWAGDTGSRNTGLGGSDFYNRARHYGASHATWTTVDPIWPDELAYAYVAGNPTTRIDPQGLQMSVCQIFFLPPPCEEQMADAKKIACQVFGTPKGRKCAMACMQKCWGDADLRRFNCMQRWCARPGGIDILPPGSCGPTTCGETRPGIGPSGNIGVCPGSCSGTSSGCNSDGERRDTALHEALHLCESLSEVPQDTEKRTDCTSRCMRRCPL